MCNFHKVCISPGCCPAFAGSTDIGQGVPQAEVEAVTAAVVVAAEADGVLGVDAGYKEPPVKQSGKSTLADTDANAADFIDAAPAATAPHVDVKEVGSHGEGSTSSGRLTPVEARLFVVNIGVRGRLVPHAASLCARMGKVQAPLAAHTRPPPLPLTGPQAARTAGRRQRYQHRKRLPTVRCALFLHFALHKSCLCNMVLTCNSQSSLPHKFIPCRPTPAASAPAAASTSASSASIAPSCAVSASAASASAAGT